jgi:hypothetical protein
MVVEVSVTVISFIDSGTICGKADCHSREQSDLPLWEERGREREREIVFIFL